MKVEQSLLVIDKSPGPTSFDVVRDVKRLFRDTKVGHTGTLDPFASGVLVLMLGRATKLSGALLNADKEYRALLKLGERTDTLDRTGKIVETLPVPELTEEKVRAVLSSFLGTWNMIPPMYSAKKHNGVRLYELARKNIEIEREPVPVEIKAIALTRLEKDRIEFELRCSKGTYLRVLAEEIGKRLGTTAHLEELRRLACGQFRLGDSVGVEQLSTDKEGWARKGTEKYLSFLKSERLIRPVGLQKNAAGGKSLLH